MDFSLIDKNKFPDELSIVMPCLNEAETLAVCINKADSFINSNGVHGEIIVADLENPVLTGIGRLLFQSGIGDFHC